MSQTSKQFYVKVMGDVQGPYTSSQLKQLAQTGRLLPDSHIRSGKTGNWVSADRVKGLKFSTSSPRSRTVPPTPQRKPPVVKPPRNNKLIYAAVGGAVLLTLAIIGAILFFATRPNSIAEISQTENQINPTTKSQTETADTTPPVSATPPDSATPLAEPDSLPETKTASKAVEPPKIEKVSFDIKGMKIGDPLTDDFAYNHCPAKDKGKPDITGSEFIEIDGSKIFVLYQFDQFKLVGVSLSFDSGDFTTVVAAYKQKFGVPPHSIRTETVTTRQNVEFENVIATWATTSGAFVVQKYASKITDGSATLHSPEYDAYWARRKAKETEDLGNKL